MGEWFEEWFGEEYLELYPHRDGEDAARVVGLIERSLSLKPGARVLDICCGAGRHAYEFARRGYRTTGVDLSRHLLQRARQVAAVPLARADVRELPFRPRSVDLSVNLFTSFGYFEHDAEHLAALRQMLIPVRAGGWFVLDYLNADTVRSSLVPCESLVVGPTPVTIQRWLHDRDRFVVKTITTPDGRQFMERVRLYPREELVTMIAAAGGRVRRQFGDYDGAPPGPDAPRMILMAQTG
jgi:SAM-dependent methyltransferase